MEPRRALVVSADRLLHRIEREPARLRDLGELVERHVLARTGEDTPAAIDRLDVGERTGRVGEIGEGERGRRLARSLFRIGDDTRLRAPARARDEVEFETRGPHRSAEEALQAFVLRV